MRIISWFSYVQALGPALANPDHKDRVRALVEQDQTLLLA